MSSPDGDRRVAIDGEPGGQDRLPSEYTVRVSARARRVTLRMSLQRGLEVVVPKGFDARIVPAILRDKASWIARMERRLADERAARDADPPDRLPQTIYLRALDEEWTVEYRATEGARVTVTESGLGRLRVSGSVADRGACRAALGRWLSRKARRHLVPWLDGLSREQGLPFGTVAVRAQRSRWGSCSPTGTISLNKLLLFLPADLVSYVLLHELCHRVRRDHSHAFWAELRRREPRCDDLRRQARSAGRYVPGWAREVAP